MFYRILYVCARYLLMSISNFYEYGPDLAEVEQLVIMLHGVGSNGQDLISLAPMLSQKLPKTMFLSPDAPFACDMVPPGFPNSYQWFSLQDRDPHMMLAEVKNVFPLVEEYIEAQMERYGVPPEKTALLGFSQGTMTSLYVAPRLQKKIAGVLGYSGALLWDSKVDADDLRKPPIHLIHGEADDVVPVEAWTQAKEILGENGFQVGGHTSAGLTHSIDQKGIDSGQAFLKTILVD